MNERITGILPHGDYYAVLNSPESHEHYAELNAFLLKHLKK